MPRQMDIEFKLDRHTSLVEPAARMWVDTKGDDFDKDEKLTGIVRSELSWRGQTSVPDGVPVAWVLVRYIADVGARYKVTVLVDGRSAKVVPGEVDHAVGWVAFAVALAPGGGA